MSTSPLARPFPDAPPVRGVSVRVARAGYKPWDRPDFTLFEFAPGTAVAGVTTRSRCPSPEVELCRERLAGGRARALVVNAGNSNAFTGARGREAAASLTRRIAERLNAPEQQVFAASTGVIGVPLPIEKGLAGLDAALSSGPASWRQAAEAIGTTDSFPKGATRQIEIAGQPITLVGIVKGSGMIAPDMATMLGFVFTDAALAPDLLQVLLEEANRATFSCISVDGDTSTSDTVLAFATGAAGNPPLRRRDDPGAAEFAGALVAVCRDLAQLVVRDGEGASKFVAIDVAGAVSDDSAHRVAMSIANSPLVKTAIAGGDANWGRVVMAVGKAGEPAERDLLSIRFGGVEVARQGAVVPGFDEAPVAKHLAGQEVSIAIDLGLGEGRATVWTCDLTHGYISINADYRS